MMDYHELAAMSSYKDSLKIIEADIQHANLLAASIPRAKSGSCLQMKLVCSDRKLKISSCGRKATIRQFYAVILPSLQRLHGDTVEPDATQEEGHRLEMIVKNRLEDRRKLSDVDLLREDECGICLEPCTKMVAPSCCHAMCINCYHEWNTRSESCPFCRGSLKRVNSEDLWVLTCIGDVVDTKTVLKEDILRFYLFINNLPKDIPDDIFLMYYEHLI
ncbi:hypothetical protein OIU84_001512 [Salix udensis]|uniref:RING-type domain-containing protein n=1 Tax=Salix udensis TaxID=889485 RepID=A0AAD6P634_9ROSI|nr:hypothetical protein OIU84_001512 [Salix udensis]